MSTPKRTVRLNVAAWLGTDSDDAVVGTVAITPTRPVDAPPNVIVPATIDAAIGETVDLPVVTETDQWAFKVTILSDHGKVERWVLVPAGAEVDLVDLPTVNPRDMAAQVLPAPWATRLVQVEATAGTAVQPATLARLRKSLGASLAPRRQRVLDPSPATITVNAAGDPAYNRTYSRGASPATWPVDNGPVTMGVTSGYEYQTAPTPNGVRRMRFMIDRDRFAMLVSPAGAVADSTFETYIDGLYQGSTAFGSGANQLVTVVIPGGVHKPRLVEIVGDFAISSLYMVKPGKAWKPTPLAGPKVLVVGDSYVSPMVMPDSSATSAVPRRSRGAYQDLAPLIGLTDMVVAGVSGTGYLRDAVGSPGSNYRSRLPGLLAAHQPDVLVIHGGGANDYFNGYTVSQTRDQVVALFTETRAAWPDLRLVFVEGFAPPGFTPANANPFYVSLSSQVRAALTSIGVYYVDVATTDPWINGAGNIGTPNADNENANTYVGGDAVHLTAAGHLYVRERMATALRKILTDDGSLLNMLV